MQEETSYIQPGDLLLINLPNPFSIYAQTYQVTESNTTNFTLQKTTHNSPRTFVSEDIPDIITGTHRGGGKEYLHVPGATIIAYLHDPCDTDTVHLEHNNPYIKNSFGYHTYRPNQPVLIIPRAKEVPKLDTVKNVWEEGVTLHNSRDIYLDHNVYLSYMEEPDNGAYGRLIYGLDHTANIIPLTDETHQAIKYILDSGSITEMTANVEELIDLSFNLGAEGTDGYLTVKAFNNQLDKVDSTLQALISSIQRLQYDVQACRNMLN